MPRLLEKRGITDPDDLSSDERATYDRYRLILSGQTLSVDSLKEFCQNQIRVIEGKCNGTDPLTLLQQACIHVYLNLLKAIEAPEAERESLEKYLNSLIN